MKYIDRMGNITIEDTSQDRLLKHLYNDWGGKLCLKVLTRPFVSRVAGLYMNSPLSKCWIDGFVRKNHIDLSLYEPKEYTSYNDFFTRNILPENRPIASGSRTLISPCDGKLGVSRIDAHTRFFIKGTEYTVSELLRSHSMAQRFMGGYAVILRLTVDNYHHFCYPASGVKSPQIVLPGCLHTVNPAANEVRKIYAENAREYCLIKTKEFGTIAMMEVGAMMIGKISNVHPGKAMVTKGQEKGCFEFGGSTVILLLQHNKVRMDEDLLYHTESGYETTVIMGERIGESKLSKRTGSAD